MPYKDPAVRKAKQAEYSKTYYERNKRAHQDRVNARKTVVRKQWQQFKSTLKCTNCSENHPATLDFHHINRHDPSNRKVYLLAKDGMIAAAIKEIREKCIVLCANCHRKHHYAESHGKKIKHKA
jgi:hypothetical protein